MTRDLKTLALALFALLVCEIALAHSDGIYNPTANNVGNFEGIDSNKAASGSTLACTYTPVTTGTQNVAYTGATPSASGGVPAYTFSETGALPSGLTISSSTGVISGTPSVSGTFTGIQVKVADTVPTSVNCGAAFTLVIAPPPFQGIGDVSTGWIAWGSCARVFDAALANSSTSLCDLVDSAAPTVVICTLRGTTAGLVDLVGTYCTGSVTPSAKCAAATGGLCNVSKVYDQTGTGNSWTQTTAANQPTLIFNAVNSLPAFNCGVGAGTVLASPNITTTQPFSQSVVYIRNGNFTTAGGVLGASSNTVVMNGGGSANTASIGTNALVTPAANDAAWHGINMVLNNASSSYNVDGVDTGTAALGSGVYSATPARFCRSGNPLELNGYVAEGGISSASFSATVRGNIYSNQHGSSGYNGAF